MKYMLAQAMDKKTLESKVNQLMTEHGWEPLGAVAVVTWKVGKKQLFGYSQVLINQSE